MRYQAEHKDQARERVLAAAAAMLYESGVQGIGVAAVMERAGLTHGAFYAHFESKDALILAAAARLFSSVPDQFEKKTLRRKPPEAVRAYVSFYLSSGHRDSTSLGCPLALLAGDVPKLGSETQLQFGMSVEALSGALSSYLGSMDVPDPEGAASSVVAELVGALSLSRGVRDRKQSDLILARSRRSVLVRLGLGTHPRDD